MNHNHALTSSSLFRSSSSSSFRALVALVASLSIGALACGAPPGDTNGPEPAASASSPDEPSEAGSDAPIARPAPQPGSQVPKGLPPAFGNGGGTPSDPHEGKGTSRQ